MNISGQALNHLSRAFIWTLADDLTGAERSNGHVQLLAHKLLLTEVEL